MYSSGTTGRPKGAVWTHGTTLFSSLAKIIDFDIVPGDATVVFGPLFHVGPLMDLAIPLLLRGGRLVVGATTGFDPAVLMRTIAAERASIVTIYPTMWRRVLSLPDLSNYDTSSLRLLFTGGEPIPIPLLRDIYTRFPTAGFINTYGSTESGPITTFLATEDRERKIGSVGKPAFSVEVRIADETGSPVANGTVGELLVRSPFVCNGYIHAGSRRNSPPCATPGPSACLHGDAFQPPSIFRRPPPAPMADCRHRVVFHSARYQQDPACQDLRPDGSAVPVCSSRGTGHLNVGRQFRGFIKRSRYFNPGVAD